MGDSMSSSMTEGNMVKNIHPKLKLLTLLVVIVAPFSGLRYGLDMGVIGGALKLIASEYKLTATQQGFIVSAILIGGALALLIAGFLSDIFGRKKMIIVGALLFVIGVFIVGYSNGYHSFLAGRLIMGSGIGITSVLIPLYLAEVAPAHIRGIAIVAYQLWLTIGIFAAYTIDLAYVKSGDWRSMFLILNYPGIVFLVCCFVFPESPVWYFLKGRNDLSIKVLNKIHHKKEAAFIMHEMEVLKTKNTADGTNSFFKKAYIIPFLIALVVASLSPLTGIDVIINYCPTILTACGISAHSSIAIGVAVMAVNVGATVIAILLIERLGRKPLLLISSFIAFISLIVIAFGTMLPNADAIKVILIASGMFVFIFGFAIGIGVVMMLAVSELLPSKIRARGVSIAVFSNTVIDGALLASFLDVKIAIGYSTVFFILGGITLFNFIFTLLFFPETKGKSIEEIEESFRK